jgi:TM2 domain-containing membrane protein YozV
MVQVSIPSAAGSYEPDDLVRVELRNPWLAGLLAWLVPGLGHLYQGRTGKGLLYFICIVGMFVYGLTLGGSKVVYAATSWEQQFRWHYYCQLGVGLPSFPMLIQADRVQDGKEPLWNDFMAPPRNVPTPVKDDSGNTSVEPNELGAWIVDSHPYFELGTVYTVVAGLLNLLAICDATSGPLILSPTKKKEKAPEPEQSADVKS